MTANRLKAFLTAAPIIVGFASIAPAVAAPAAPTLLKLHTISQSKKVQKVHCRRVRHTHRRCTLWRGGVCRRWVQYTHRCG